MREIREKTTRRQYLGSAFVLSVVTLLLLLGLHAPVLRSLVFLIVAVLSCIGIYVSDKQRKTINVAYELDPEAQGRHTALLNSLQTLASCNGLWRITSQRANSNPKYSAGAKYSIERSLVRLRPAKPPGFETSVAIWGLMLGGQNVYFLPDRMLVYQGTQVGAVEYSDIVVRVSETTFIEDGPVPADTQVVGTSWKYPNRNGGPDRRFANNPQLPTVRYGEVELTSSKGMHFVLHASCPGKAQQFASGFLAHASAIGNRARPYSSSSSDDQGKPAYRPPRGADSGHSDSMPEPHTGHTSAADILQVRPNATRDEVTEAYHRMARQYHPDKVAGLGPEFRELAERRMKESNAAYEELKRQSQ